MFKIQKKRFIITKYSAIYILGGYLIIPHLYFMEDNQIYSIQLLENEGITPSTRGEGYDKSYCPTKQEFIDSGFSKSGYDIFVSSILSINQLIPKNGLSVSESVIKFDVNPISLYPCSDYCWDAEDGSTGVASSATVSLLGFTGKTSIISEFINGTNKYDIFLYENKLDNETFTNKVDNFEFTFTTYTAETINGVDWSIGDVNMVLPANNTNENKKYYLVFEWPSHMGGTIAINQRAYEIIQSKYWEPPYWSFMKTTEFPSNVPKAGGKYNISIKDPYDIGWTIELNSNYNISEKTSKGDYSFDVTIPKATRVGSESGIISARRPAVDLEEQHTYDMPDGTTDKYVYVGNIDCSIIDRDNGINIYQQGLDKPSLSKFPSTMTLPDTKKWESAPNGNMDYLVGSSVTNSDYVEYMIQLPNWCICKGMDISFHSGGTNCYSGTSPYVNFSLQINPNSYFDKSHYDGDMKLYYKQDNRYYLADTKKIVKCARPSMETALALNNGNIVYNPGLEVIYVKDEDSCGYELTISGDSNYSAWTFTVNDAQSNRTYYGDKEFGVSIPQNLTDNDIEGYINLHSSYYSNQILESIPFKQECYKLKVYFTGQNFEDGYSTKTNFKYLTLWDRTVMSNFIPLADDFNPLNVSEGISIRKSAYTDLDELLMSNHFYDILCSDRYIDSYLSSNVFVTMAERVSAQKFYQITDGFSRQEDSITIYL